MKQKPLVSIITPCYNGAPYLEKFFSMLIEQTYNDIELILVNDGSTDETDQIVEQYTSKVEEKGISFKYVKQENKGVCGAINTGLQMFSGEYLMCIDCDDWMTVDSVKKKVYHLEQHPEQGLVRCKVGVVMESNLKRVIGYMLDFAPKSKKIFDLLVEEKIQVYPPIGWMMRSDMFLETHPERKIYDKHKIGQNYQLILPLAYHYESGYIDETLAYYLIRDNSASHSLIKKNAGIERSYKHQENCEMAIRSCNVENEELYLAKVRKRFARCRLEEALNIGDKEIIDKVYQEYCLLDEIQFSDRVMLLKKYKVVHFAFRCINFLKRKIKRIE